MYLNLKGNQNQAKIRNTELSAFVYTSKYFPKSNVRYFLELKMPRNSNFLGNFKVSFVASVIFIPNI